MSAGAMFPDPHSPMKRTNDSPQKSRKVYIKTRPLEGLPKGNGADDGKMFADLYSRYRWLHWGLEVGPWTMDVAIEGKKSSQMTVRSRHHSQCHDWEDEVDRMRIGRTSMTDYELDEIRMYHGQHVG